MDTINKKQRSWIMSRVSRKNTSPERIISSFLRKNKIHFKKNVKTLPGSPDIVIPKFQIAIFVNGCFWHGHKNCKYARRPSSNKKYWYNKIDENIARDKRKSYQLRKLGWKVLTIWQCQLKTEDKREKTFQRLSRRLEV